MDTLGEAKTLHTAREEAEAFRAVILFAEAERDLAALGEWVAGQSNERWQL